MAKKHPFLNLLLGYEAVSDAEVKGKRFVSKAISGRVSHERPSKLASKISAFLRGFVNLVSYTSTRTYGLFLGGFGLLSLILHFGIDYFMPEQQLSMPAMLTGAIFAILAIPLLSFDRPIAIAMQEFWLTDAVFFEFFCIQRMQKKTVGPVLHPVLGLFLGLCFAVLGAFVPIWYVAGGIGAAVYIYLTVISPEFAFFFTFLAMPYLPMVNGGDLILAILVALALLSFVRKIAEGKRIYYFEQYDFLLLIMLVIVFVNGVIIGGAGSVLSSFVMLVLGFGGYALTGSLVANRRLADCVIKANIISSIPISLIAITQFVVRLATSGITGYVGASATFDSPDMLGAFLLISASFMLYFVFVRRHTAVKVTYGAYLVITVVAMACTLRAWIAVAVLFALLAYLALKLGRVSWLWLGLLSFLPYILLFLPDATLLTIGEFAPLARLGFGRYFTAWVSARSMLGGRVFVGVGTGNFADAPHSANFLLQIACEAGVLVLIVFLLIFVVRLRHRSIYSPYTDGSQVSLLARFSDVTIVALLVYGLFVPLWAAPTVYYLFWCVFGLGSAVLRISKHEFDDMIGYFSDGAGADSSAIDISLKR